MDFLKEEPIDLGASLMVGDRETDRQFAQNIGIQFFKMETNGHFPNVV
jgi:histidinol phosphatase-like enzyme